MYVKEYISLISCAVCNLSVVIMEW